jgi:hypothetical protein
LLRSGKAGFGVCQRTVDGMASDPVAEGDNSDQDHNSPQARFGRVDHSDLGIAAKGSPPDQRAKQDDDARNREQLDGPASSDEASALCLVGDQGSETTPPRTLDVNGQEPCRDCSISGESCHHMLEHQAFVREQRITLVRRCSGTHASEFVIIIKRWEETEPATRSKVDHRGAQARCGERGVIRQHVHNGRGFAAQCTRCSSPLWALGGDVLLAVPKYSSADHKQQAADDEPRCAGCGSECVPTQAHHAAQHCNIVTPAGVVHVSRLVENPRFIRAVGADRPS